LAKYYYHYPPEPYSLRVCFDAENREILYSQYIALAKMYNIEFSEQVPIPEQVKLIKENWLEQQRDYLLIYDNVSNAENLEGLLPEQVKLIKENWVEKQRDCLLIYDNVSNAENLEGLLPEQGKHHIIITTRNEVDWPTHQMLAIDVVEEHESMKLLEKMLGFGIKFPELAKVLGYLPLPLAQAGAYIEEKSKSVDDYLELYARYPSYLMSDTTLELAPKHEPIWTTFDKDFKELETICPSAMTTLKLASSLDGEIIQEKILKSMLEIAIDEPINLLWNDIKGYISQYSLMDIDAEKHEFKMHTLVQNILRE